MNPFSQSILQAKKRQQRLYMLLVAGFVLIGIVIVLALVIARGTRIIVAPDAALPASVSVEEGIAVAVFGSVYSLTASPEILVTADRYYPHRQVLNPADYGQKLKITLKPLPSRITFTNGLSDKRTVWKINDDNAVVGDSLAQLLSPGDYTLTVRHPHYQQKTIDFSLEAGEELEQHISLPPITGKLVIDTTPAGANVIINDEVVGKTPQEISLDGGFYDVAVSLPEYETSRETVEITCESPTVKRDYRLQPVQATINLDLKPSGGNLSVNGMAHQTTQKLSVEAGKEHRITYRKPGYFSQSETVTVDSERAVSLAFDLAAETGDIEITASPSAAVEVGGKSMGNTPVTLTLQALPQHITLSRPGYRAVNKTITPTSTSTQKITATLVPEAQAKLNEAPRKYEHSAGGEMALFIPDEVFTMGAARDEAGQRANEFLRQIRLSRPFYAGVSEVTNRQFQQFKASHSGAAQLPVTSISWLDAVRFCNWLSEQEELQPVYQLAGNQLTGINDNANGYRLLSEAEWEWLARKAKRREITRFVWGNDTTLPENSANIADESAKARVSTYVPRYNDGYAAVAPVKSFSRESSGLYDMGGNVSEWTHDVYTLTVPDLTQIYPQQLDSSQAASRVIKGASWRSGSLTELRSAYREGLSQPRNDVGFRVGRYLNTGES